MLFSYLDVTRAMKLRIGRNADNDVVLNFPQVSRNHAEITRLSDNVWIIEDLGSTGGTFVNGRKVKKAAISPEDSILLASVPFHPEQFLHAPEPAPAPDPQLAFQHLKTVYETYESTKLKIQRDHTLKVTAIRAGLALIPFVGNALGILASGQVGPQEKLIALDKEFRLAYVCPSCKTFLGNIPWEGLVNMGACPRCRISWN